MPGAILAFSINVGATRFDRFDSLLGSVGPCAGGAALRAAPLALGRAAGGWGSPTSPIRSRGEG
eukprot:9390184-Alexandrium_andersonii.AAC.1